jgi:hypothetical protein
MTIGDAACYPSQKRGQTHQVKTPQATQIEPATVSPWQGKVASDPKQHTYANEST